MLRTLNTLSTLVTCDLEKMTLEEIAKSYRGSLNPSLLAAAFKKTYRLILDISNRYYGLSSEDIASFSLEKLDSCLQTYEADKAAFTTFFTTHLINKFREETQSLNTHKRKALFYSNSYETMVENGYDIVYDESDQDNLIYSLQGYDLTDKEFQYCDLILKEWTNKEIANVMDVSVMTLSNIRKRLREKLTPLAL